MGSNATQNENMQSQAKTQAEIDVEVSGTQLSPEIEQKLALNDDGLIPVIVQDYSSERVLMMAWMDCHALAYTLHTSQGTYWSRSRGEYWVKGLTSGHTQLVRSVELDCDGDTLLLKVDQVGAACHNGTASCFDTHTLPVESRDDSTVHSDHREE